MIVFRSNGWPPALVTVKVTAGPVRFCSTLPKFTTLVWPFVMAVGPSNTWICAGGGGLVTVPVIGKENGLSVGSLLLMVMSPELAPIVLESSCTLNVPLLPGAIVAGAFLVRV